MKLHWKMTGFLLLALAALVGCSKPAESLPVQIVSGNEPVSSVVQTSSQSDAEFFTFTDVSRTGVQNRAGKILVEAKYSEIVIVPQGAFLAKISDHNFDLYNQQGELVMGGFSSLMLVEQSGGSVIAGVKSEIPGEDLMKTPFALHMESRTEAYFTYIFHPDTSPLGPAEKWVDIDFEVQHIVGTWNGDKYYLNYDGTVQQIKKRGVVARFLDGQFYTENYYIWNREADVATCLKNAEDKIIIPYGLWYVVNLVDSDRFIIHSGVDSGVLDPMRAKIYDLRGKLISEEYNQVLFNEGNKVGIGSISTEADSWKADCYLIDKDGKKLSPVYTKILYDKATQTFTATGKDGSTVVYDKDGNKK